MSKLKTTLYDTAAFLDTEDMMAAYLEAALEDGDVRVIVQAIGTIARARGMTGIAQQTGLSRASLYKALSPEGNPEFSTILKVVRALGLRLRAESASSVV
jgi:probable addiction module antidote protein